MINVPVNAAVICSLIALVGAVYRLFVFAVCYICWYVARFRTLFSRVDNFHFISIGFGLDSFINRR